MDLSSLPKYPLPSEDRTTPDDRRIDWRWVVSQAVPRWIFHGCLCLILFGGMTLLAWCLIWTLVWCLCLGSWK
ncbi:hypothetical protein FRUB_07843 [Fimbriiglobus ruber]|uniref:Uncharacterized protein n=1 Tax=Fimbriiglobus ruber TaxID=1908690 RepID=A0A225DCK5_9BACT|nr:hypothetical protein FRUB_07843 [Fimbriiglobus ruber]